MPAPCAFMIGAVRTSVSFETLGVPVAVSLAPWPEALMHPPPEPAGASLPQGQAIPPFALPSPSQKLSVPGGQLQPVGGGSYGTCAYWASDSKIACNDPPIQAPVMPCMREARNGASSVALTTLRVSVRSSPPVP